MEKIWTLEARDTVFFDVFTEHLGLSYVDLGPELRSLHAETVRLLATKGIAYRELRAPLVPHTDTVDVVLIFDSANVGDSFYGLEIARRILQLVDPVWRGSILAGDLIHPNQDRAFEILSGSVDVVREAEVRDTCMLYAVYLSNLSEPRVRTLLNGLAPYLPFVGSMRIRGDSAARDWMSGTLVNCWVKQGNTFIGMHEDDRDGALEVNMKAWPLEEAGYRCVSLPALYFDTFLSYKIERAVFPGFESDTLVGLSAISSDPQTLKGFTVFVDPPKVEYLRGAKAGLLGAAGLTDATAADLERKIAAKVNESYVYELQYREEHQVSTFSVIVEFEVEGRGTPVRLVAALAYEPALQRLRLVTLSA